MVYTDEAATYSGLQRGGNSCEVVQYEVGEYVRGLTHTNGIASFWSNLKRAHIGTCYKISPKHLDRYETEFTGRHDSREHDTIHVMATFAEYGLYSWARS